MFGGGATTGTDPARRKDPGALHGRRWWIGCSFWWLGRIIYQQKHWLIITYYNYNIYYHHLVKSTWVSESYWCGHKWVSILYTDILDVDHLKMAHGGLLKCAGPKSGPPGGTKNGSALPSSNSKAVQFAGLKTGPPREPENRFNGSAFWMWDPNLWL